MPERFKVTRAEEPDREAVHGKLLPTYAEVEQKGKWTLFIRLEIISIFDWESLPTKQRMEVYILMVFDSAMLDAHAAQTRAHDSILFNQKINVESMFGVCDTFDQIAKLLSIHQL